MSSVILDTKDWCWTKQDTASPSNGALAKITGSDLKQTESELKIAV